MTTHSQRSTTRSSSSFAIRWCQFIGTALVVIATLVNQTEGFKTANREGRKLFGGYRITPKQCRATKTLPNTDPRASGPTICMFNHECAQLNGEVVGACMDGFLFGACCQVPHNQQPENTLISDAQNSYYHQYQNHKLQQQETETNKIVSQAYETFVEQSAQQQLLGSSHNTQNLTQGGTANNDNHQQIASEENSISTSTVGFTEIHSIKDASSEVPIHYSSVEPSKNNVNQNANKISSTIQTPQNDDFVLQVLNTLPPGEGNKISDYPTEIPSKITSSLIETSSSESNSFEEEPTAVANKTLIKKPEGIHHSPIVQQYHTQPIQQHYVQSVQHQYFGSVQDPHNKSELQQPEHHAQVVQHDTAQLFEGVSFTHSDITHPGADADLIDDLQFSTGYGPQPVFVPAPSKPIAMHDQEVNKHTTNPFDATTSSSSSITTHVDSIETIIQQLNNNSSNPGPAYNIIKHNEPQQHHPSSNLNKATETATNNPISHNENENTKGTILTSLPNNQKEHKNKQNSTNLSAGESTTSNAALADELVLENHTVPDVSYNDFQSSKHPTSDFNKMPAVGLAYPVDMSYMEEEGNLDSDHQSSQISYINQRPHDPQISYLDNKHQYLQNVQDVPVNTHEQQQNIKNSFLNAEQQKPQNEQATHSTPSQAQTLLNNAAETHQRPIASYIGMVTSQNYNSQPVPNDVIISSHTTKIEENTEVVTEYKPIITTNQIITTAYKTTTKPVKHSSSSTLYMKRPAIITQQPTKVSNQRPSTTNNIIIQQHYFGSPIETKTPSPAESSYSNPTLSYNPGTQQNYIMISASTPKPIVSLKPTKKQSYTPASTSYISGPTTPRPLITPQFQYDQKEPLVHADDKLDSFVHSTAENLASQTSTPEAVSYDTPVFISVGAQVQSQRPQYNTHQKPSFIKIQPSQRPPATATFITPKPAHLQTTSSSITTALSGYDSTSFVHHNFITRRPDTSENAAAEFIDISTVNSNDFDDPGYYASPGHFTPGKPTFSSGSTESFYIVPTDDRPAFPGYYGPTPTYPAFPVPGEKLESPIEGEVFTSTNDFINFPPVRNPNLNLSATSSAVTSDLGLPTPAFVEDNIIKNNVNPLFHKIAESLQENFEALANMLAENNNNTAVIQTYEASPIKSTVTTKKPTRKPTTKPTTARPKVTTKKPITRVSTKASTKKPATTRRPQTTTKRPVVRRTTTTTKKPATKKPNRKPTTTAKPAVEEEVVDEEDEEDVNPSNNEIVEEDSYGASGSGRKIQCGTRPHIKSGRVVGGKGVIFGYYPWQVLVRESTWLGLFTKNKCGGVLITNRYVITAAHCQPGFLASLVAVMGEYDISGDLESKRAITKNVRRVIVHRQYDPATFENDIALLELDSAVTFDTHIVPICMPSDSADFTGRMATVTGWGRLKYGGGVPSVLQEVQVPIIENSVCQEMFHTAGHNKKILNSFLCAGYANGQKDSCEGDSGGPLVLQRADGRYELAGTVSHGIKCAAPYLPGVYMRTTFYKPWLRSITGVK